MCRATSPSPSRAPDRPDPSANGWPSWIAPEPGRMLTECVRIAPATPEDLLVTL